MVLEQQAGEINWRKQIAALFTALLGLELFYGSKTYDPPSIANNAQDQTTVTVTGALLGDFALATFSLDTQGVVLTANVSAADTATVTFRNATGGAIDLGSGTLAVTVAHLSP